MKEEKTKPHFFQRWYEKTPTERIWYNTTMCAYALGIMIVLIWLLISLTTARIEGTCTTGNLGIKLNINESMQPTNISINGINGMSCTFKMPAYMITRLS